GFCERRFDPGLAAPPFAHRRRGPQKSASIECHTRAAASPSLPASGDAAPVAVAPAPFPAAPAAIAPAPDAPAPAPPVLGMIFCNGRGKLRPMESIMLPLASAACGAAALPALPASANRRAMSSAVRA